jgi:hypothetical protein
VRDDFAALPFEVVERRHTHDAIKAQAHLSGLEKALVLPAVPEDRLGALRRLAQRLAWEIDEVAGGRAVAVLSVQLRQTLSEIAELAPLEEDSPVDQILARRAERIRQGKPVPPSHAERRGTRLHG